MKNKNIYIYLVLIVIIIILGLHTCKKVKPSKVDVSGFIQTQKVLTDSINKLSKQIKIKEVVKDSFIVQYKTKVKTIIEYKEKLVYGGDTSTLIAIYDSALYVCDSLNNINDLIIFTQKQKINALDSIYINENKKSLFLAENIKQLNKDIRKQHRQSQGKIIGFSSLSFLGGIGTGFLISKIAR
jgi:hypothetical protein